MFSQLRVCWLVFVLPLSLAFGESSALGDEAVDYEKQIKPLLKGHCVTCHGALRQRASLRLDTVAMMLKGGESGPAVDPSHADKSRIIARVSAENKDERMPPDGEPLTPDEIKLLSRWISQGAKSPENERAERDPKSHWAYIAPARAKVPTAKRVEWNAHPIDAFVGSRHDQQRLEPSELADKSTLLRRVYLDLIGLPPTKEQLAEFLADDSSDAYGKVVEGLLKSPHYGERWGRHWMDVWRYSDWYGYQAELRNSARHMWRWRDWIVQSLNDDKPYDQMIVEMLAADEVSPQDRDSLPATGFLARHYYKFNRNTWMERAIEHSGKAFVGLTFNCARCHDHMFDPISQKEYYQFRAIFAPYDVRTEQVAGETDVTQDGLSLAYDANLDVKTFLFVRGNDKYPDEKNPLDPTIPEFFSNTSFTPTAIELPAEFWYPGLQKEIQAGLVKAAEAKVAQATADLAKIRATIDAVSQRQREQAAKDAAAKNAEPGETPEQKTAATTTKPDDSSANKKSDVTKDELKPFLVDDFSMKQPHWDFGPGQWDYKDGKLIQSEIGAQRRTLTSKAEHPRDFSATFRVKILGGEMWKSVGLDFDGDARSSQTFYISAVARGSKLQYSYQVDGQTTYPPIGSHAMPIEVGKIHELRVDVRGELANAYVDGKRLLAVKLLQPRRAGRFLLWAFDAHAEFLSVKVEPLAASVELAAAIEPETTPAPPTLTLEAELDVAQKRRDLAEAKLLTARAELSALAARIEAENLKYLGDAASDAGKQKLDELSKSASALELSGQVAAAKEKLLDIKVRTIEAAGNEKLVGNAKTDALAKLTTEDSAAQKSLVTLEEKAKSPGSNYAVLSAQFPKTSSGRRTSLAVWIANKDNPLTARVAVNHIWLRHFSEPLVSTVFDFGMNGKEPTHPELLDWLAIEFMESGWSMKHIHRLIVSSRTYRMSSKSDNAASIANDPDNQFLWRMNTRRMESEIVRDCILASSQQLDRQFGGPELEAGLGQTTFRRSIYYRHAPEKLMDFLELFDTASTDECYRRNETVAPQQSLALVNSRLALEQSRILATKLAKEIGGGENTTDATVGDSKFLSVLFRTLLSREPQASEAAACLSFLDRQAKQLTSPNDLSKFTEGPKLSVGPAKDPHQRARENLVHALMNHNDFVTIR